MDIKIIQRPAQLVAYIRVIGSYSEVIGGGFERLIAWSTSKQLTGEYLSLYWDNPNITPTSELKTDVAVTVPAGTTIDGDIQLQTIPAGEYAVCRYQIENDDFETPWRAFFAELAKSDYQFGSGACFDRYLNNGMDDGFWDIEMVIPVIRKK